MDYGNLTIASTDYSLGIKYYVVMPPITRYENVHSMAYRNFRRRKNNLVAADLPFMDIFHKIGGNGQNVISKRGHKNSMTKVKQGRG